MVDYPGKRRIACYKVDKLTFVQRIFLFIVSRDVQPVLLSFRILGA